MTTTKKKACVILGAGASWDVANDGAPIKRPEFRPPLARELFNMQKRPEFWTVMIPYDGAKLLSSSLAPLIELGEVGVEDALREYAYHSKPQPQQHFKHIPAYLRDLMYRVSTDYVDRPGCYIQLVEALLINSDHEVLFLVLNYDTLLESALTYYFDDHHFSELSDYTSDKKDFKVVKIHGSVNWFRPMNHLTDTTGTWVDVVRSISVEALSEVPETDIFIQDEVANVSSVPPNDRRVYPVLTAPLAGKRLDQAVCPDGHLNFARDFLADCQKFLIVGTSGLDDDLMELLQANLHPGRGVHIHIVDSGGGAQTTLSNFQSKNLFRQRLDVMDDGGLFKRGFREYVAGPEIRAFAEY